MNVVVWGQVKNENSSLPVAVRVSKTRMLKLPIMPISRWPDQFKPYRGFFKDWEAGKLTNCENNFAHMVQPSERKFPLKRISVQNVLPASGTKVFLPENRNETPTGCVVQWDILPLWEILSRYLKFIYLSWYDLWMLHFWKSQRLVKIFSGWHLDRIVTKLQRSVYFTSFVD